MTRYTIWYILTSKDLPTRHKQENREIQEKWQITRLSGERKHSPRLNSWMVSFQVSSTGRAGSVFLRHLSGQSTASVGKRLMEIALN